jgi:hypothetical protein
MPRFRSFNNTKKLKKYVTSRKRDPTNKQLLQWDAEVCCICGEEDSAGLHLQAAYSNEKYCVPCFRSCESSQSWWGRENSAGEGEDNEWGDSFDTHISDDGPIHTLTTDLYPHTTDLYTLAFDMDTLEYLMCNSQANARQVPSIRPSKTPYYSMVSDGNQFGTFAHESQAVKVTMDRVRKKIQRKAKSEQERVKACLKVGYANTHFCALFPANEEPNFAGDNCLGQWD